MISKEEMENVVSVLDEVKQLKVELQHAKNALIEKDRLCSNLQKDNLKLLSELDDVHKELMRKEKVIERYQRRG